MSFFKRLSSPEKVDDELIGIRKKIAQTISIVAAIVGTLAYFSAISTFVQNRAWVMVGIQTAAYIAVVLMSILKKLSYQLRVWVILVILYLMGTSTLFESGLAGEGRLYLTTFALMAFVLLEFRQALAAYSFSILTVAGVGWAMSQGYVPMPAPGAIYDSSKLSEWITGWVVYLMLAGLLVGSLSTLIDWLQKALQNQRHLSKELQAEREQMEQRIEDRTRELQQRAFQLETASQYSQEISQMNDLEPIIRCTVATFQNRLSFSNLTIFLIHSEETNYVFKDGVGTATEAMQSVRIPSGQPGPLSRLIDHGEPVILRNAGEDAGHFSYLGLNEMKMILLLPFRETGRTIGAIFVLFEEEREITASDLQMYRNITDQLGAALEKSRLLYMLQKSVEELKLSNQQVTQRAWRSYLHTQRQKLSYRFDGKKVEAGAEQPAEATQALRDNQIVVSTSAEKPLTVVAAPIALRDQPLGVIDIRFNSSAVPDDLVSMVEEATKRLALALENVRLMDEAKQRAEREHMVSDISSKVRASSDIDGILKTAALELGRSLGVSEVLVQLRSDE